MMQEIIPSTEVKVVIKVYDHDVVDAKCMAYLEGDEYRGVVVQAKSIPSALKKLAVSLEAINQYRLNTQKCTSNK
jgi:hypothetical protein